MNWIGHWRCITAIVALASFSATANADDGKKLFLKKTCIACHGKEGRKAILDYPNLAGQDAKYLLAQMLDIKSGARVASKGQDGNPRTAGMVGVMHLVTDAEMKAIADWLAGLAPVAPNPANSDADRIRKGADMYKKSGCMSCHGPEGKKPLPAHPYLAGTKTEYTALQLKDIREGVRRNGKVKTMVAFAKKLDDEKIALIADYLSTVQR